MSDGSLKPQATHHQANVWEIHAKWWQETFTDGADEEYETQMLPLVTQHLKECRRVLDLGTGEGQVARTALASVQPNGFAVGIDYAFAQVAEGQKRGGPAYLQADVAVLPFVDEAFDAVSACLVLEHVAAIEPVFTEIARVLQPQGRFLLFLNHPAFQTPGSGWIDDHILEEQYWRSGPYLREQTTVEQIDPEVSIPFAHRPLSTYINAMAGNGLLVTEMVEPAPPLVPEYPEASTIPRLLFLVSQKV